MFEIVSANFIFVTLSEIFKPTSLSPIDNFAISPATYSFNLPVLFILLMYSLNNAFCSPVRFLYLKPFLLILFL